MDTLSTAQWKAAAFSVGGLPPLTNYPLSLPKAVGVSASSPHRCRHTSEEHWGALPTASMQLLTLPWDFPGKSGCNPCVRAARTWGLPASPALLVFLGFVMKLLAPALSDGKSLKPPLKKQA